MKILIQKITIMLLLSLITNISFSQTTPDPYYDVQSNENGDPLYFKHQIIIAFSPELLKKNVIDNKELIHGKLSDFFTENAITLATNLGIWNNDIADAPTSKIYPFLDSDDTLSLTRSGEIITISKYWATLLVYWPTADTTPIIEVCDSLNKFYPIIEFAHPNYFYQLSSVPNDPLYYTYQQNLQHDPYNPYFLSDAHMNIENAWDIETGSSEIKLGIYDYPINYTHEDFGGGTLATSKIKGGKVYYIDAVTGKTVPKDIGAFTISTTYENHGTLVAGIAAAIRNNDLGIAGVAGGDFAATNVGTSLYTFGIFGEPGVQVKNPININSPLCSDADASAAIVEGANYILQPNGSYTGYGLDIENHSWGGDALSEDVKRAIKGAARNQCVLVCSRGNNTSSHNTNGTNDVKYPATYNDEWVLSVGASGSNKERLNIFDKNVGGADLWSSMYGKKMDVLAPGSLNYVASTLDGVLQSTKSGSGYCLATNYCNFDGTSASAPHVSGLASLLLSKYRPVNGFYDRLEPEDIENLIEQYADHKAPSPLLYNDDQGWGLIDPDNTLDKIKNNKYKVYHFANGWPVTHTNKGNVTITLPVPSIGTVGLFGKPAGSYNCEKWEIKQNYTHTYGVNEQILGYWKRLNSTFGSNDFGVSPLTDDDFAEYSFTQSGNVLNVEAKSYAYKIIATGEWLYKNPNQIVTAFSVHTYDSTKSNINESTKPTIALKLYPNPATKQITIELNNSKMESFLLFDINGRQQSVEIIMNSKSLVINTANLPQGFYICKTALSNGTIAVNKLLINN